VVVHENGQILDSVEEKLVNAKDYARKGEVNLVEAKEFKKKANSKRCYVIVCLLTTLFVLGSPVIITTLLNQNII
jgi:hypothetical protein